MDNLGFQHEEASFSMAGEVPLRSPRLLPLITDSSRLLKASHSPKLSSSSFNLPKKKSLNRYRRFSGSLRSWSSPQNSSCASSSVEQVSTNPSVDELEYRCGDDLSALSRYSLEDSGGGGGCSECQSGDIYCITGAAVGILQANNFKALSPSSLKNMQLDCHSVPSPCSLKKNNIEMISDTSLDIISPKCLVKNNNNNNNNNTYRSNTPESPTLLKKHQQALNNLRTNQGRALNRSTTLPTITINNMVPSVSGNVPFFYPGFPGGSQQNAVLPSPRPQAENRQNMRRSCKYLRESGSGVVERSATLLKLRSGGWKLQFIPSEHSARRRVLAFCCLLLVSCVLAAAATAALVVYMTTGMKSVPMKLEGVQDAAGESGVNVVGGEFRITNEMYEPALSDDASSDYKQMAAQITQQLNLLYLSSALSPNYNHSHVTGLLRGNARGILVQCKLVLSSAPPNGEAANLAGLEFLRGLHHRQGQMWLGNFAVDVQSVGFVAVIETPKQTPNPALVPGWSPWSTWSECNDSHPRPVQSRTRDCRLNGGNGVLVMSIEPCLLLEGAGGDMEMRDCEDTVTVMSSRILESLASNDIGEGITSTVQTILKRTTDMLQQEGNNLSATHQLPVMDLSLPTFRHCDECLASEVCVALGDEEVPTCRQPLDPNDPTGCGGHCRINTELCHKLDVDAFRCLDDSYCLSNEWRCANQLCIPQIKRCDGHMNCYDHTDEYDCECDLKTHFHCGNNTSCLPLKKRCDSIIDCWDGSDELNCTIACPSSDQFTCTNGQCIPHTQFCDGFADCLDKSDEPFGCGGECKNHEWKCGNGRCIKKSMVCDGTNDCGDKTDEMSCPRARRGRMSVEIH